MTKKLIHISATLILAICVTVLSGCQPFLEWFVRNYSDKEVLITLRFETKRENYWPENIPIASKMVPYKSEIIKINQATHSKLIDSLQIIAENDDTYKISLPAKSTVDLTTIIPTTYGHRTNVIAEFEQEGTKYAINSIDFFKKHSDLKMAGGFLMKTLVYFDYGKAKKRSY